MKAVEDVVYPWNTVWENHPWFIIQRTNHYFYSDGTDEEEIDTTEDGVIIQKCVDGNYEERDFDEAPAFVQRAYEAIING